MTAGSVLGKGVELVPQSAECLAERNSPLPPIRPTSLAPAVCEDLCKPIEPNWLCVCLIMLLLLLPARGCPPEAGGCGLPARG